MLAYDMLADLPNRDRNFEEKARNFTDHAQRLTNTAVAVASGAGCNNKHVIEGINKAADTVCGQPSPLSGATPAPTFTISPLGVGPHSTFAPLNPISPTLGVRPHSNSRPTLAQLPHFRYPTSPPFPPL